MKTRIVDLLRLNFVKGVDVAELRQVARRFLGRWQDAALVDDALLVITELVENAVQHTAGEGELVLCHRDGLLRIEVADTSSELPRVLQPDPSRIGGRGLLLIAALAQSWGTRSRTSGKIVWAELSAQESHQDTPTLRGD